MRAATCSVWCPYPRLLCGVLYGGLHEGLHNKVLSARAGLAHAPGELHEKRLSLEKKRGREEARRAPLHSLPKVIDDETNHARQLSYFVA